MIQKFRYILKFALIIFLYLHDSQLTAQTQITDKYVIYLDPAAPASVTEAASELKMYLNKTAGKKTCCYPISKIPKQQYIALAIQTLSNQQA